MGRPTGLVAEHCKDVSECDAITTHRHQLDRELMPAGTEINGDEREGWIRRRFVEVSLRLIKHFSPTLGSSHLVTCSEEEGFKDGVKAHRVGLGLNSRRMAGPRR